MTIKKYIFFLFCNVRNGRYPVKLRSIASVAEGKESIFPLLHTNSGTLVALYFETVQ